MAKYGISVEDANGNLKSTYDVLSELKPKWDEMSDSERVALGVTLAGKNQYKVLASVMSNFSTAAEATTAALNSSGSAARENARYMESIEARITAVKAAFQQMSTAVVDSDLVKGILDIGKGLAEFGSTDFGAAITQFTLLSGLSWGGLQLLGQSILPGIINSFKAFAALRSGTTLAELAKGGSLLGAALGASLPYILAITAAIVGLVAIIKGIKEAYDKANPSVEEAAANMEAVQESLQSVSDASEKAAKKLEALNNTEFKDRTSEIQAEIDRLQALVSYYEAVINLRNEEKNEAVQTYVSAVEREGFDTKQYTAYGHISNLDENGVSYGVKQFEQAYNSLEEAIIRAAAAEAEFNNNIIDVTNISSAQKELENLGWSFTENSISTKNAESQMFGYLQQLQHGVELTPAMADGIVDLLKNTNEYANALVYLRDNNIELNEEQKEFLFTYEALYNASLIAVEGQENLADANGKTGDSARAAADALAGYAQELINAANAYQIFKNKMSETGDFDDAFKGMSSILSEITGEMEKGQYGSKTMITALELLTGKTFDAASAQEYLNQNYTTLKTLFGDAESGGLGLIDVMQTLDNQGKLNGATITQNNDGLLISVDNFSALAESLGISEGALFSLTEATQVFGVNFQYSAEDILSSIGELGEGILTVQDGVNHIDFAAFVNQMQEAGKSKEEIEQLQHILENTENVQLDGVAEGLVLLESSADNDAEAADELNGELSEISSFDASGAVGQINSLKGALSGATSAANILKTALMGISLPGFAEGTSYAKEGPSLVNEEGPELIQSGDEAYIAGGGFPTIAYLHKGDKVYTAEETEDILDNNRVTGKIQAHENGTGVLTKSVTGITGASTFISKNILKGTKGKGSGSGGSSSKSSDKSSNKDEYKEKFDNWLKAKKHALAMDEITEEEYYEALKEMNDKYFKGKKKYQDEYWKYEEQIYAWEKKQIEQKAKEEEKAYKEEFDKWLKKQEHDLNMDLITQEEYYEALEEMNDKYFKDKEEYQDEYWRYEEKIYAWRKKKEEEQARTQEEILKEQIDLEKKLNDLAKAKATKIKVFQDGQFRYVSDREALAKAQGAISGYDNGTYSANGGLSLVGENGAELRVLNKGDGILPSEITKNLLDWGSLNPNLLLNKENSNSRQMFNFDIDGLVLPNIHDANSFVDGLKSLALQYSTQRG